MKLAAEQGYAAAESDLAFLYETGRGLPLDYVAAHTWYTRAVAGGVSSAVDCLKYLSQIMTPRQLAEANVLLAVPPAAAQASSYSTPSRLATAVPLP